jgi:MoaA/NifB/PqqE/SkfB family radical SAM enzyme
MCSIADLLPKAEEVSKSSIFHIINEAAAFGIKKTVLTGGEPFLRGDIFEISEYSSSKGIFNTVTTNGILIDDSLAEKISNSKINHIHFSIDGKEKTHDFLRGNGVFKKATEAISLLNNKRKKENFFSMGIACTIMDRNVHELFDLVKLAEELGVESINFQPLIGNNADFSDKNISSFWISNEKLPILRKEVARIRKYRLKRLAIYEEPRLELLLKYYERKLTRNDWRCFGGFKTVFICYEKSEPLVYSCHGVCGNLKNISLKAAWQSKEAYRLRAHSRKCRELCLQSCYSYEKAQSLTNLLWSKRLN